MDPRSFDALAKAVGSPASRRAALGAVLAALGPAAAPGAGARPEGAGKRTGAGGSGDGGDRGPGGPAAENCTANGRPCGKGAGKRGKPCGKCCSRYAVEDGGTRRCSCKPAGTPAGNPAQCCAGRVSTGGFCGACDPGLAACPAGCVDLGTDAANCGTCGNACDPGQRCAGGECACDAQSCPQGCCDGDACRDGTGDRACGTGGAACASCASPQTCGGGNPGTPKACGCTPDADTATCAGKCGTVKNNCGIDVPCGACCEPVPDAETCAGKCGTVKNNCGIDVPCTALCDGCCEGTTCLAVGDPCGPAATCSEGVFTPRSTCQANGACPDAAPISCAPYRCAGSACATSCGEGVLCSDGNRCCDDDRCGACCTDAQCAQPTPICHQKTCASCMTAGCPADSCCNDVTGACEVVGVEDRCHPGSFCRLTDTKETCCCTDPKQICRDEGDPTPTCTRPRPPR